MKITQISSNGIYFDNNSHLSDYHSQDCCESVYADWEGMQVTTNIGENSVDITQFEFNEDILKSIELVDIGFILTSEEGIRFTVSCYNKQNGYYSSNLELQYKNGEVFKVLDISGHIIDEID